MPYYHKYNRKAYLPHGLITSIGLPLLCCIFIYSNFNKERYVIEVQNWNPKLHERCSCYPKESHPQRDYTTINLSGNNKGNSIKLSLAQALIREHQQNDDTIHGVHITLGPTSEFRFLIQLLDICYIEKARSFVCIGNDFWIYNPGKPLPQCIPGKKPPPL